MKLFILTANITSPDITTIEPAFKELLPEALIKKSGNEFIVTATLKGVSSMLLNKALLSSLHSVEEKTQMSSEWKSEGMIERYVDYELRGMSRV